MPTCSICKAETENFSSAQKKKAPDKRKCKDCVDAVAPAAAPAAAPAVAPAADATAPARRKLSNPKELKKGTLAGLPDDSAEKAAAIDALFAKVDINGDGEVSKREVKTALKASGDLFGVLGLKRIKDVHTFIDQVDADGDGRLDPAEFRDFLGVIERAAAEAEESAVLWREAKAEKAAAEEAEGAAAREAKADAAAAEKAAAKAMADAIAAAEAETKAAAEAQAAVERLADEQKAAAAAAAAEAEAAEAAAKEARAAAAADQVAAEAVKAEAAKAEAAKAEAAKAEAAKAEAAKTKAAATKPAEPAAARPPMPISLQGIDYDGTPFVALKKTYLDRGVPAKVLFGAATKVAVREKAEKYLADGGQREEPKKAAVRQSIRLI